MKLTVNSLYKHLGRLIANGHGRKPVCINKDTFTHPLEGDGANILHVHGIAGPTFVQRMSDDGGGAVNQDGTESGTMTVVLVGEREAG